MVWSLTDAVVHHPEWTSEMIHRELLETANEGGRATPVFADPVTIRGIIRPAASMDFEVTNLGNLDAAERWLIVDDRYGVENDDRIEFRGVAYRAVQRQIDYVDEFSIFGLIEDSRTQTSDSGNEEPPDSGTGSGGDYDRGYEII